MSRISLNYSEKRAIAHAWISMSHNQTELARLFGVCRRTIQRALIEVGAMAPYRKTPIAISVDEVIEKVVPNLAQAYEEALLHGTSTMQVPPAPLPLTEQTNLAIPHEPCIRHVNVYDTGPAPVMHLSREHALKNRSMSKRLIKTVPVEIPL